MVCWDAMVEFCIMLRFTKLLGFCGLFLLCANLFFFDLVGRAQLSYEPQEHVLSSKDSLDFMTQMWHALPCLLYTSPSPRD